MQRSITTESRIIFAVRCARENSRSPRRTMFLKLIKSLIGGRRMLIRDSIPNRHDCAEPEELNALRLVDMVVALLDGLDNSVFIKTIVPERNDVN